MKKLIVLAGIVLFLAGVLLASYMVTRQPPRRRGENRSEMPHIKPATCFLNAKNGSHYTVHLYSRDTLCPATWRYSVTATPGYKIQVYLSNGSKLPPSGSLLLGGNASLIVKASRVNVTLKLVVNAAAPYLINGSQHRGNLTLILPWGATINITLLRLEKGPEILTPLNRSLALNVTGNLTVRLVWELRCRGVSFRSEPVRVKGLPKCLPAPVTVEFPIEGPAINGTHRWWLAWYWVEENGSKWWWSPGINGTKLHITKPANVTLHYLPGLKNLPYVKRVVEFPDGYFNGSCPLNPGKAIEDYRLEHGWLHVYNPRKCAWEGDQTISGFMIVTFEIPVDVRLVNICIRTEKLRGVEIEIVPARPGMIFANTSIVDVLSSRGIPGNNICLLVDLVKVQGYTRKNVIVQDADQDFRTGLNKYGFVKLPADYYKHCSKYCWKYPQCSSCRFLTIELSTTRIIAKEMWVSIMGVAP